LVPHAYSKVTGFKRLHKQLKKKSLSWKILSTLDNYVRCIAHVALHFNRLPFQLDIEQIDEYDGEKKDTISCQGRSLEIFNYL
jgi:hypothetical protein